MAIIRKIKLPDEQNPIHIGALSSNIIYDGVGGETSNLNTKLQSIPSISANSSIASGVAIGTITINGITTTFFVPTYDGTVV